VLYAVQIVKPLEVNLCYWAVLINWTWLCYETFDGIILLLRTEFGSSSPSDKQLLTIYDLDNKFIAYSASFDDVVDVVAEWGSFYILTRDGRMCVLQEKDTQTKLEVSPEWRLLLRLSKCRSRTSNDELGPFLDPVPD